MIDWIWVLLTAGMSLAFALLILLTRTFHGRRSYDKPNEIRKLHQAPVIRIGGLASYLALLLPVAWFAHSIYQEALLGSILICITLAFVLGFMEDMTGALSPRVRLLGLLLFAALLHLWIGIRFDKVQWDWFDLYVLSWPPASFLMTLFFVGALIHGYNIIDGLNGLMWQVSFLAFGVLALLGYRLEDSLIASLALLSAAAMLGPGLVNLSGRLFFGDGGAYLAGALSILLALWFTARHPYISAWWMAPWMGYPALEVLFSFIRKLRQKKSPFQADHQHLHSILFQLYRRKHPATRPWLSHLLIASILVWGNFFFQGLVFWLYQDTLLLIGLFVLQGVLYGLVYAWSFKHYRSCSSSHST